MYQYFLKNQDSASFCTHWNTIVTYIHHNTLTWPAIICRWILFINWLKPPWKYRSVLLRFSSHVKVNRNTDAGKLMTTPLIAICQEFSPTNSDPIRIHKWLDPESLDLDPLFSDPDPDPTKDRSGPRRSDPNFKIKPCVYCIRSSFNFPTIGHECECTNLSLGKSVLYC
jgi:hypothetical protein